MKPCVQLQANDNVANVLEAVIKNDCLSVSGHQSEDSVEALENIRCFHKVALTDIASGTDVVRDGYVIGRATRAIQRGAWVHVHNLESKRA